MKTTKVRTQAELEAALEAKAECLEIHGEWTDVIIPKGASVGYVYIRGSVEGSVYICDGASVGYVYIYKGASVEGSVYIYKGASVGFVTIDPNAKVGKLVDLREK